jgi:hypothetical protein
LARARSLQDLHLVRGGSAQPGAARPPQTGIAPRPGQQASMTPAKSNQLVHPRSSNDSFDLATTSKEDVSHPNNHQMPPPSKPPKNVRLWTGTSLVYYLKCAANCREPRRAGSRPGGYRA